MRKFNARFFAHMNVQMAQHWSCFPGKYPVRIWVEYVPEEGATFVTVYRGKPTVAAFNQVQRWMRSNIRKHPDLNRRMRLRVFVPTGCIMRSMVRDGRLHDPRINRWFDSLVWGFTPNYHFLSTTFKPFRAGKRSVLIPANAEFVDLKQLRRVIRTPFVGA